MPYVRALARAGGVPVVLPPLPWSDVPAAGAARRRLPVRRPGPRPGRLRRRARTRARPDRARTSTRSSSRSPATRDAAACRSSASAAAPGAERRARRDAAPAPARSLDPGRPSPDRAGLGATHAVHVEPGSRLARVLGAERSASTPSTTRRSSGSGAGCARSRGRRTATIEGDRGRRASGSCSACSGTPRRSTTARRTRGCSTRSVAAPRTAARGVARRPPRADAGPACAASACELRRDGPADREALERMGATLAPRGPDGAGLWRRRRRRARSPAAARSSTSPSAARSRWSTPTLGLAVVFNGCIYNHRELRAELEAARARASVSDSDTEVLLKGWRQWGEGCSSACKGMFAFALPSATAAALVLARDRLGIKPLYLAELPGGAALRLDAARAAARRRRRHHDRPGRAAPLPAAGTRSCPRRARSCAACASCRRRRVLVVEPDGRRRERRLLGPALRARPARAAWTPEDWQDAMRDALRVAVRPADGGRRAGRRPALRRAGLEPDRRAARRGRASAAWPTFSIGFPDAGGREGDEFEFSDLVAERVRHRPPPDPHRRRRLLAGAAARRSRR